MTQKTEKSETKSSPIVKRTHSEKVAPVTTTTSNAPQAPEAEKRPVLRPAPKIEPKKPEESRILEVNRHGLRWRAGKLEDGMRTEIRRRDERSIQ